MDSAGEFVRPTDEMKRGEGPYDHVPLLLLMPYLVMDLKGDVDGKLLTPSRLTLFGEWEVTAETAVKTPLIRAGQCGRRPRGSHSTVETRPMTR